MSYVPLEFLSQDHTEVLILSIVVTLITCQTQPLQRPHFSTRACAFFILHSSFFFMYKFFLRAYNLNKEPDEFQSLGGDI